MSQDDSPKVLVLDDETRGRIRDVLREIRELRDAALREMGSEPAGSRTQAFIADRNDWRTDRRARGRKA